MINYDLPHEIEIDGKLYPITRQGDYRVILDVITALNDNELSDEEKTIVVLLIFYGTIPENSQEALKQIMWFINCGENEKQENKEPPMMDWEQDFHLLIAPINNVMKTEIRQREYIHWWTFVSAYLEIGECTFSNVVAIRKKRASGKKLDKQEQEYFNKNPDVVLLKKHLSQEDIDFMNGDDW